MARHALAARLRAQSKQQSQAVAEAPTAQTLTLQLCVGSLTDHLDVEVPQQTKLAARTTEFRFR
jgi:hypothetical protein